MIDDATPGDTQPEPVQSAALRSRDVLRVIRPPDTAIAVEATLVGARLAGLGWVQLPVIAAVSLSNAVLISASAAFNDWHDVEEDSVNRPSSPVASGKMRREHARILGCALFVLAVVVAAAAGWRFAVLACAFIVSSVAYTLRLKTVPLLGNALVAVLSSYAFWCWMVIGRTGATYATLALCLYLFCLGREILGMARDVAGDAAAGIATVATTLGAASANRIGAGFIVAASVLAWLPVLDGQLSLIYAGFLSLSWLLVALLCARAASPRRGGEAGGLVMISRVITVLMAAGAGLG